MRKIIKYPTLPGFSPGGFYPKTVYTSWDSWRLKKQMGAGGHQLEPVSQVTVLAIVTSRLEPRVYIPRSCSGSARSCPFTSKPPPFTDELGAERDVITPIRPQTGHRTGKWSPLSCLLRRGRSVKSRDLPSSTENLGDSTRRQ